MPNSETKLHTHNFRKQNKSWLENEIVYLLNYISNNNFYTLENQTQNMITGAYSTKGHGDQFLTWFSCVKHVWYIIDFKSFISLIYYYQIK